MSPETGALGTYTYTYRVEVKGLNSIVPGLFSILKGLIHAFFP